MIIERHTSPDGLLKLIIDLYEDENLKDFSIGLEEFDSHTHGDLLAESRNLPEKEAIRRFVDEILNDRQIFVVSRIDKKIRNVWWITDDDIESQLKYKSDEEELEFRFWSGKSALPD
jgi:hypothetical protein